MNGILKAIKRAALVGVALLAPHAMAAVSGAIYTSTFSGTTVNENVHYAGKQHVYLNGGPQGTTGSQLTPGKYFFQVTTPNDVLLSTDSGWCRMISVGIDGRFAGPFNPGTDGTGSDLVTEPQLCPTGIHAAGATNPANGGGVSVQLIPYLDTTNNGGEYKVWLIDALCDELSVEGSIINFKGGCKKTDNFKVDFCPNGATANPDGTCPTVEFCPDGSVPVNGLCPCPDGQARVDGVCPCPNGTPPVEGVCPVCPGTGLPVPPPPQQCQEQRPPLVITVTGQKYLDVNADGTKQGDETNIAWVNILLTLGSEPINTSTDEFGNWSRTFTFDPVPNNETDYIGYPVSLTACEETMSGNWLQTGPNTGATTTNLFGSANGARCWSMPEVKNDSGLDFGNICWGVPGGGHTKGFWSNKNGAKVMTTNNCFAALQAALPMLVTLNGNILWPVSPPAAPLTLAQFQKWLTSSNSSNAASQLSAQLAAMWLNVKCNPDGVADGALVYEPSLTPYFPGSGGFVSIEAIIAAAAESLAAHPITIASGADRTKQLLLMTALDRGNNNLNWVGNASTCIPLDDWVIIDLPQ
jgi:hypothetical protein